MENDRMFIINKVTGHRFYIARNIDGKWYGGWDGMNWSWDEYLDVSAGNGPYEPHAWTIGYEDTEEEFAHLPRIDFKLTPKEDW